MGFSREFFNILLDVIQNDFRLSNGGDSFFSFWKDHVKDFMELFYRLEDKQSQEVFLKRLKYCMAILISGSKVHEKYTMYPKKSMEDAQVKAKEIEEHLKREGLCLEPGQLRHVFVFDSYKYGEIVSADIGDTVLDCGACQGDTVVYFFKQVSNDGKIYCFEPMPSNYAILKQNIECLNSNNISAFNYAVCDVPKTLKMQEGTSIGSHKVDNKGGINVKGIPIDDFILQEKLDKVDFIKMDIEGSELEALEGARRTIQKYMPKLAICIYHKPNDFVDIPKKILDICSNYHFYMSHSSPRLGETVLFARAYKTVKEITMNNDEVEETKKLFSCFWNVYQNKQRTIKSVLLMAYIAKLREYICDDVISPTYLENCVQIPLSDDKWLHYDISIVNSSVRVGLHFEGRWSKNKDIFQAEKMNRLQLPLKKFYKGFYYEVQDAYDIEYVGWLMGYLIEKTFPILLSNVLISDKIYRKISINNFIIKRAIQ